MSEVTGLSSSTSGSVTTAEAGTEGRGRSPRPSARIGSTTGLIVKLVALAFVNALGLWGINRMADFDKVEWAIPAAIGLVVLDVIYLSTRRFIPGKYLYPGTVLLLLFALYPVAYNVYISFTNYGTGNNLSQNQAVALIERNSIQPPTEDAARFGLRIMADGDPATGALAYFLTDEAGVQTFGTADGIQPVDPALVTVNDAGRALSYGTYVWLNPGAAQDRAVDIALFSVPTDEEGVFIKNEGFSVARTVQQGFVYNADDNTMVDTVNNEVYVVDQGAFVLKDAEGNVVSKLEPGWRANIGFDNYKRIWTDDGLRTSFGRTFIWTFIFAILSVLTTFALGLLLAMVFNNERMRGKKYYRSLLIIPYALPSFMTALVWQGMMNTTFGIINRTFGWSIPWLDGNQGLDRFWPYFSILLVNLWLGYPYMFLVTTGALQGIPSDLKEAAFVDDATGFKAFRKITFPLLLVSVAPLLISSFAFNFNNFNLIYLLTGGGPPIQGSTIGRTDIMISAAWKYAFGGGRGSDYGLAAAISVIIFIIVATISAISFRFTKTFEEVK